MPKSWRIDWIRDGDRFRDWDRDIDRDIDTIPRLRLPSRMDRRSDDLTERERSGLLGVMRKLGAECDASGS